jgi:uncharacterized protein involved in exopolysaccharide biosynthesis
MASPDPEFEPARTPSDEVSMDAFDLLLTLAKHWRLLAAGPLLAGVIGLGMSFLMIKTYVSRTVLLPPQQQQSAATAALSQLGALSGALGATTGLRSPADQYVALLQSTTIADRIVDAFELMRVYEVKFRFQARSELAANARISAGRKDGMITIEVEDTDAQRAADMANRFVDELRSLSNTLTLTEAQQRRAFFEQQLVSTRDRLASAQKALEASGFNQGALRADARAAAEGYARMRAETTAAEVRLQTLRRQLADNAPEVQAAAATLAALRAQLDKLTSPAAARDGSADYIGRYREFKYQETLFDLYARQFEIARLDESREGVLIQVVDPARPAEWKTRPKRANITVTTGLLSFMALAAYVLLRDRLSRAPSRLAAVRRALRGQ